ncbi:MAG: hypothetical protein ACYTFW_06270 [Planctomycetota bacterium]|jgi:uncharacterized repeat protein (TIGR01451 family)
MRKLLNISFLLLVLGLCGSFSCESWRSDQQTGLPEPGYTEDFFYDEDPEAIGGAPVEITSTLIQEQQPAPVRSGLMAVSESGSSIVSRAYPWPECGVVQLDKTMPKEVGLNRAFNYSIKVTNLTDTRLTDIVITEELPGNFRFISANPTAKEDMNKLVWELDMLGPKANKQLTVSGMATYSDTLKYCTTIITPVIPACTSVEVIQPRLKLVKTAPAEVLLCDSIPTKFVVANAGTGSVPNVKIIETLPPGLRTTDGKSQLVFEAGTLMAGQSRQFSTELRATKAGTYVSKAVASSASGLRAESAETTTVVGLPVLTIRKTGFERQYIGRPINYEITVTNKSDVSAKNTVIEDTIPEGVDSVKATAGAKLSGSKLVWEIGTLAPDASKKVVVSYTPNSAGTLMSSATATAYCTETVTDSVRTAVTGIPAVLLEVVDVEDPVRIGSRATYVIRVTNQGSATATNIRITCILEDNVRYISSAGATTSSMEGDTIRFLPLSNLAPKAKAAWRVVVEAVKPGDMRFKAIMNVDQLTRPVEETESTHLYE